jgi:hypothetical protein
LDIFWALKGATLYPLLLKIRQKAVAAMDLPTSLPVPKNMMALAISPSLLYLAKKNPRT